MHKQLISITLVLRKDFIVHCVEIAAESLLKHQKDIFVASLSDPTCRKSRQEGH